MTSPFVGWPLFFRIEELFNLLLDLWQCLHCCGIAVPKLAVQGVLPDQCTQLLRYVPLIPIRTVCSTKNIGWEFGHILIHSVTVKPIITGCKRPVRMFVTPYHTNTTKWSQKRSQKMVQAAVMTALFLFISGKWCPHTAKLQIYSEMNSYT